MKTVVGLMDSSTQARSAVMDLLNSGFQRNDISTMASDVDRQGFMSESGYSESATNFRFLPVGTSSLTDMGVHEDDAQFYSEGVNRGGFLLAVSCDDDRAEKAADILRRNGAVDIDERSQLWRKEGWTGYQSREAIRSEEPMSREETLREARTGREGVIPVAEEEIEIGKREIQTGGVRVYSRITTVPVEEEITLREQHAKVERRPVERAATEAEREAFQERSFEIRETAEEPVIAKQVRVKEEVIVGTEASERTEQVRDTLRRTEVEVEHLGESGRQPLSVSEMDDAEFERHFRSNYGLRGERLDEPYRSAYHFADAECSSQPQLLNKEWYEVEENVHQDWEKSHPGTWAKVQDAIHFGWDRRRHH